VIIVVTATALARKNGAPTFVNFSVRALPLGVERGSLHLYLPFLYCNNAAAFERGHPSATAQPRNLRPLQPYNPLNDNDIFSRLRGCVVPTGE
jgi:hypothetical protein